jgi:signal transduction histidine kinase
MENDAHIEPGLLSVFRLLTGLQLALFVLAVLSQSGEEQQAALANGALPNYPALNAIGLIVLLVYLVWRWPRHKLGRWYLPIAFAIATLGPLLAQMLTLWGRVDAGFVGDDAFGDGGIMLVYLMIPFLLLSSQYGLRTVVAYCIVTAGLEVFLALPVALDGGPGVRLTVDSAMTRTLVYILLGYILVRLMSAQRVQRRELAAANERLTSYAVTLEQLAVSRERNRMARELHDTLAHTLSLVAIQLEAQDALWETDPDGARKTLASSRELTRSGLTETRRALQALRASPLEDLGLALAIRELAETTASRAGLKLALEVPEYLGEMRPEVEQSAYRIAEEALNNIARHADARRVRIRAERAGGQIRLEIIDDGRGFDQMGSPNGHYGLVGMRERAALCSGTLDVQSKPGMGTVVRFGADAEAQRKEGQ